ncbi:unnamed protein product [Periconia digitata]|uniref:Rhodopsin domain-containing protein n=1 Tax=Periconia digitata TaxID=1303443 RepID=A0A9W4UDN7_9PLEO|nr:unnamed protein product [Periconia digitata]
MHVPIASSNERATLVPRYTETGFLSPHVQAGWGYASVGVTLPLMLVLLFLRLYTRIRITRKVGADDYLAIIAAVFNTANCGLLIWLIRELVQRHATGDLWGFTFSMSPKCRYVYNCIYSASCIFVKCALLVHYLRIFKPSFRARLMIWIGIVVVILAYLGTGFSCLALCFMGKRMVGGSPGVKKQMTVGAIYDTTLAQGIMNVVTDFYCLIIPLHLVIRLRLPLGQKLRVALVFLVGLIPCIASIAGVVLRFEQRVTESVWESMPVLSLGIVELNIALSCNCLTTLVVLFKDVRKRPAYLSLKRLWTKQSASDMSNESSEEKHSEEIPDKIVHDIPNPVMTGLRSFIRRVHNTKSLLSTRQTTAFTDITDVSADTVESQLKEDYHNQLKAMR